MRTWRLNESVEFKEVLPCCTEKITMTVICNRHSETKYHSRMYVRNVPSPNSTDTLKQSTTVECTWEMYLTLTLPRHSINQSINQSSEPQFFVPNSTYIKANKKFPSPPRTPLPHLPRCCQQLRKGYCIYQGVARTRPFPFTTEWPVLDHHSPQRTDPSRKPVRVKLHSIMRTNT